jgi:hypothetical protein
MLESVHNNDGQQKTEEVGHKARVEVDMLLFVEAAKKR